MVESFLQPEVTRMVGANDLVDDSRQLAAGPHVDFLDPGKTDGLEKDQTHTESAGNPLHGFHWACLPKGPAFRPCIVSVLGYPTAQIVKLG